MSGLSTTLVFACQPPLARSIGEMLQRDEMPDLGDETAQVGLYSSSRNSAIESALPPLIREGGIAGLGFLEALAHFKEEKGDVGADCWSLLAGEALHAASRGLHALMQAVTEPALVRRALPYCADLGDAFLASELAPSPQERDRHLAQMRRAAGSAIPGPVRPHFFTLHAMDGAMYETGMFLSACSAVLDVAVAQDLAVVQISWLY